MSKTKDENNSKASVGRQLAAHIRMLVTGVAVTGGCGLLMLTDSAFNPAKRVEAKEPVRSAVVQKAEKPAPKPVEKKTIPAAEPKQETKKAEAEPTVKKMTFPKYKKAAISDYDMSAAETKCKGFKVNSPAITDPDDFTVPFPEQDTLIYYPEKAAPQKLTATRSVAGEYFRVHDENSGSTVVMNGHELLCLMVNNEIGDSWDDDAIKAQIVAAYSHLRFNQEHGLTPTIGLRYGYSSKLESIVESVEGQAMHYDGEIINAVYSASSAGYTTTAGDIWSMDYPYLKCVESEFDDQDVNWGIEKTYTRSQVKSMLEGRFGITLSEDQTKWFTMDRAYSVVYIDTVTIDGRDNCKLTGNQLCNMMGLKSNAITIKYKDGEFTFTSCGWGHGVGMSQWGAHYYAENGWTYDQILTHYYVDAKLELSKPAEGSEEPPKDNSSDTTNTNTAAADDNTSYTAPQTDYGYSDGTSQWSDYSASDDQWSSDTTYTSDATYDNGGYDNDGYYDNSTDWSYDQNGGY